jgi:hypothetical protein
MLAATELYSVQLMPHFVSASLHLEDRHLSPPRRTPEHPTIRPARWRVGGSGSLEGPTGPGICFLKETSMAKPDERTAHD